MPTKSLFEQEAPKIGTQKRSTKRGVRESCVVEFALSNRELVKAEVLEKSVFGQTAPLKQIQWRGHFPWTTFCGGHLKPVTSKPVSRSFRIFRVFVSAFSAFSAFSLCGTSSDPYFSGVRGTVRIFRIFAVSGSNRWFRKSDRPALLWPALSDWDFGRYGLLSRRNNKNPWKSVLPKSDPNDLAKWIHVVDVLCKDHIEEEVWVQIHKQLSGVHQPAKQRQLCPSVYPSCCTASSLFRSAGKSEKRQKKAKAALPKLWDFLGKARKKQQKNSAKLQTKLPRHFPACTIRRVWFALTLSSPS